LDWSEGSHYAYLPDIRVDSGQFYMGQNQAQTNVGMRWGFDTSSGSDGSAFIRAPACGASTFTTLDSLGFPGYWTFSVSSYGPTPVELKSWSGVKAEYN
jgi:hypothetical protein